MIREGKYIRISYGRNKVVVFPILRLIEIIISSVFRQFLNLYLLTTFNISPDNEKSNIKSFYPSD